MKKRLTPEQRAEIIAWAAARAALGTAKVIAHKYGVSKNTIETIVRNHREGLCLKRG